MSAVAFAMPPVSVLSDGRLSRDARLLYAVLDGRQGQAASVRVRISTLATDLGASGASVRRWMDELRAVGLLVTRQTGRSSILAVVNVSRMASAARVLRDEQADPRVLTSDRSECSPVSDLQIHKRDIQISTSPPPDPTVPSPAPTNADDDQSDQAYLAAIEASTGHRLRPHQAISRHLAAIRRSGTTPADVAAIAAAYLAMHGGRVRNPAAWLASFVLESIAKGQGAEQLALWQQQQEQQETSADTWTVARYADLDASEPCEHGEPRGARGCALCRRKADRQQQMDCRNHAQDARQRILAILDAAAEQAGAA